MTLRKSGASAPEIPGIASLRIWQEWILCPGYQQTADGTNFLGHAFNRMLPGTFNAGNYVAVWPIRGNATPVFRVISDVKVLDVFAIAGVVGAQESAQRFRPGFTAIGDNGSLDFINTWGPVLEAAPAVGGPLAMFMDFWIRKRLAGDATSSAQFVGFVNDNGDLSFSRRVARIGLMGDGVLGFRFGSLNCPDAIAGGADNLATDVDADSFQPAVLVNPGANWFHVRVKGIPGTEAQSGRFGCYLSGRLVKTYTDPARFPRTSRSGVDVSGAAYTFITPAFCAFGNGGAAPSPGYYMRNLRVGYTEDLTL
jgi:hypothetical protein